MRCPGGTCWGCILIDRFPHPEGRFLVFCANYPSCAVHPFRPFWKWAGGAAGLLDSPDPSLQAMPTPWPHCCAGVVLVSGIWSKGVCPKRVLPYLCMAFSSHILFFLAPRYCQQSLAVIPNNPCLAPALSVWHIHIPYLLGFCSCTYQQESPAFFCFCWPKACHF